MTEPSLPELEAERDLLYARLAATGDFRRGSVSENYRKCGKPNCACAQPGHPGHGPRLLWTRSQGRGKRRAGKGEDGKARTQDDVDDDGYPVRDRNSASYIATFEPASVFDDMVKAESIRRGAGRVRQFTILGDGAGRSGSLPRPQSTDKTRPPPHWSSTVENRPPGMHGMHQSGEQSGCPRNGTKRTQIAKASGSTHRSFGPGAVRHISVTIATQ